MSPPGPDDPVIVIGAGGHAKVVIESLRASGTSICGLTDPDGPGREVLGVKVLGSDEILPSLYKKGVRYAFVALGDNGRRLERGHFLKSLGFELVNAISPGAVVSPSAKLGQGIAVMAGAVINADAQIGDLAIINTRAGIDHDTCIGAAAHVGPGVSIAGSVRVGAAALIGVGASIAPGCVVGAGAVIGAGACVIGDVEADVTAVGVPARVKSKLRSDCA